MDATELRKALSREYCRRLEKRVGKRKLAELRQVVGGNSDLHSRCPSDLIGGVDSGKLMRLAWVEVTGDKPPMVVDDKTGNEVPGKELDLDRLWTDGRSIRTHFEGAFFWNRQSNYWENEDAG